jgi:hypothetical protein
MIFIFIWDKILMCFSRLALEVKSKTYLVKQQFSLYANWSRFPICLTRITKRLPEVLAWNQLPDSLENCVSNSFGK